MCVHVFVKYLSHEIFEDIRPFKDIMSAFGLVCEGVSEEKIVRMQVCLAGISWTCM